MIFAAATSPSAYATPGWLSATKLVEIDEYKEPSISAAMSATGDVIVAWTQSNGPHSVIDVARRPAGGAFSTPLEISPPSMIAYDPAVAMDAEGEATVVWLSYAQPQDAYFSSVEAAWRPVGGQFNKPIKLSIHEEQENPAVAMDAQGDTTVAWEHYNDETHLIEAASRPAGGAFGAPSELTDEDEVPDEWPFVGPPVIAMDPQGDTTVAWSASKKKLGGSNVHGPYEIQVATKLADTAFNTRIAIPGEHNGSPVVAMDPRGDTTIAWNNSDESSNTIEASSRPANKEAFEAPVTLSEPGATVSSSPPVVAMTATGSTTIGWSGGGPIHIATQPADGSFQKPAEMIATNENASQLSLAMNAAGDSALTWIETGALGQFAKASTHPAESLFGEPAFLSNTQVYSYVPYFYPSAAVAIDSQGDAVSAWMSSNGSYATPEVVGYQATGPKLQGLQAPIEGQVGDALTFSVSPLSVWSSVASTTWSWGDGSPDTSGTNVTHAFGNPGTYLVAITATDALGNTTSSTDRVTINSGPIHKHVEPPPPKEHPKTTAKPIVPPFTPLFGTRAAIGGALLGLLVRLAEVRGVHKGDTIVIRCIAGCQRRLHETIHIRRRVEGVYGTAPISPPLVLQRSTRIEVELLAPRHIARFVQYRFIRTPGAVRAEVTHKGCLSVGARRPERCPRPAATAATSS